MDTAILQITGINGNCLINGYANGILLDSFRHSVSLAMNPVVSNSERTLGRPHFSEFQCSKDVDQATPALFSACASGTKLGTATLSVGRNEGGSFMLLLQYTLGNAMISSISTSDGVSDSFTINYTTIATQYTQQNPDSTVKGQASFSWDVAGNQVPPASS